MDQSDSQGYSHDQTEQGSSQGIRWKDGSGDVTINWDGLNINGRSSSTHRNRSVRSNTDSASVRSSVSPTHKGPPSARRSHSPTPSIAESGDLEDPLGRLSNTVSISTTAYPEQENECRPEDQKSSSQAHQSLETQRTDNLGASEGTEAPETATKYTQCQNNLCRRGRAKVYPNRFSPRLVAVIEPSRYLDEPEQGEEDCSGPKVQLYYSQSQSELRFGAESEMAKQFVLLDEVQLSGPVSGFEWLGPNRFALSGNDGVIIFTKVEKRYIEDGDLGSDRTMSCNPDDSSDGDLQEELEVDDVPLTERSERSNFEPTDSSISYISNDGNSQELDGGSRSNISRRMFYGSTPLSSGSPNELRPANSYLWSSHVLSSRSSLHLSVLDLPDAVLLAVAYTPRISTRRSGMDQSLGTASIPRKTPYVDKDSDLAIYYIPDFVPSSSDSDALLENVLLLHQGCSEDSISGLGFLTTFSEYESPSTATDEGNEDPKTHKSAQVAWLVVMLRSSFLVLYPFILPFSRTPSSDDKGQGSDRITGESEKQPLHFPPILLEVSAFPVSSNRKESSGCSTCSTALRLLVGKGDLLGIWSKSRVLISHIDPRIFSPYLEFDGRKPTTGTMTSSTTMLASGKLSFLNLDVERLGSIQDVSIPQSEVQDTSPLSTPVLSVLGDDGFEIFELSRLHRSSKKNSDSHARNLFYATSYSHPTQKKDEDTRAEDDVAADPAEPRVLFADSGYASFGVPLDAKNFSSTETKISTQDHLVDDLNSGSSIKHDFLFPPFSVRRSYPKEDMPLATAFIPMPSTYPYLILLVDRECLKLYPFPRPPIISLNRLGDIITVTSRHTLDLNTGVQPTLLIGNSRTRLWGSRSKNDQMEAFEPEHTEKSSIQSSESLSTEFLSSLSSSSTFHRLLSLGYSLDPVLNVECIAREIIDVCFDNESGANVERPVSLQRLLTAWTAVSRMENIFYRPSASLKVKATVAAGDDLPDLDKVIPPPTLSVPSATPSALPPGSSLQASAEVRREKSGVNGDRLDLSYLGVLPLWKRSFGRVWSGRVVPSQAAVFRDNVHSPQQGGQKPDLSSGDHPTAADRAPQPQRVSAKQFVKAVKRLVRQGNYPVNSVGWDTLRTWTKGGSVQTKAEGSNSNTPVNNTLAGRHWIEDFPEARILGLALTGWMGPIKTSGQSRTKAGPTDQPVRLSTSNVKLQSSSTPDINMNLPSFHSSLLKKCVSNFQKGSTGTALAMALFLAGPRVAVEVIRQSVSTDSEGSACVPGFGMASGFNQDIVFDWLRLGHIFVYLDTQDHPSKRDTGKLASPAPSRPRTATGPKYSLISLSAVDQKWCNVQLESINSQLERIHNDGGSLTGQAVQMAATGLILEILLGKRPETILSEYLTSFTGSSVSLGPSFPQDMERASPFLLSTLPLPFVLSLALLYLSPTQLSTFCLTAESQSVSSGHLPGLYLTGLTDRGVQLISKYVKRSGDVLSAILLVDRVRDRYVPFNTENQSMIAEGDRFNGAVLTQIVYSGWTTTLDDWIRGWRLWIPGAILTRLSIQSRYFSGQSSPLSLLADPVQTTRRPQSHSAGKPNSHGKHPLAQAQGSSPRRPNTSPSGPNGRSNQTIQTSAIVLRCTQCLRPLVAPSGQLTPAQAQSAPKTSSNLGSRALNASSAARIGGYNAAICSHCGTGVAKCGVCLGPLGADLDDESDDGDDDNVGNDLGLLDANSRLLHLSGSRVGSGGLPSTSIGRNNSYCHSSVRKGGDGNYVSWRSGSRDRGRGQGSALVNWSKSKMVRFCIKCHHAMHERHARQWFAVQVLCPIPDCDCACNV